jgi:hypothetical protein
MQAIEFSNGTAYGLTTGLHSFWSERANKRSGRSIALLEIVTLIAPQLVLLCKGNLSVDAKEVVLGLELRLGPNLFTSMHAYQSDWHFFSNSRF